MIVHDVRNVNRALHAGLRLMQQEEDVVTEQTRVGPVISALEPVATTTLRTLERVLFSPARNANPFFHLFESLWMLAGRNDLPWLAQYNKRMASYSDDGGNTQPGAYGHRWRSYFGYDQLEEVIGELKDNPNSRRAVLAMWDPGAIVDEANLRYRLGDLHCARAGTADVPCNTHCYFRILNGALDMTVCCRSNDLWWGAHGANAVHFSILLEYVAARLGVQVGTMTQMSNNYHVYTDVVQGLDEKAKDAWAFDLYSAVPQTITTTPLFTADTVDIFDRDLMAFVDFLDPLLNPIDPDDQRRSRGVALSSPFLCNVAMPMSRAWDAHKVGDYAYALEACERIGEPTSDWRWACHQWMLRAKNRKGEA